MSPTAMVFGASGLIGEAVASGLIAGGFPVVAVARRFSRSQSFAFGTNAVETPVLSLSVADLAELVAGSRAEIIVNCIGVLQDSPRGTTEDAHEGFVARLVEAVKTLPSPPLLIHLSVPGGGDLTPFSRTKRAAERAICESGVPYAILRPGFVVAPAAYGGSALVRALAAFPVALSEREEGRPFAAAAIADIIRTVAFLVGRWQAGERGWSATWDVMERDPGMVGSVVASFRRRFGGPAPRLWLPSWLLSAAARAGDAASWLGWLPPVRTTALRELRRGVAGDPSAWMAATGIEPASLDEALRAVPATVQESWFGRLYGLKAVAIVTLALFWAASGLIALTAGFPGAAGILVAAGFPAWLAGAVTVVFALADLAVAALIALRRTARSGLLAGIGLTLAYLLAATILAPGLWLDPLGALAKAVPVLVLMLIALAILNDRSA